MGTEVRSSAQIHGKEPHFAKISQTVSAVQKSPTLQGFSAVRGFLVHD